MNMIETHGLWRRFGRTEAVRDLSFSVPAGSVCALLGANGAGKTTTLRVLMNLVVPSGGSATVLGCDSRRLGERELAQIGYVSENQRLPEWMTVRQYLDYCRSFYPTWDAALEATLLTQFALPGDRALKNLSRGMRMKTALVAALAYRPKLLVLDEPFSGLDPLTREEVVEGLLETAQSGEWTVLVSSHDVEEVERLADRIVMLENGALRFAEETESLLGRFRRVEVTLGSGAVETATPASGWLRWERAGTRVCFVDTAYERERTEQACRERFPDAAVVAHPMTLREIFVCLARSGRGVANGAVA